MRKFAFLTILIALSLMSAAPTMAQNKPTKTIAELAAETKDLSTLLAAVKAADPSIAALLANKDANLTLFAPTNAAFEKYLKANNTTIEKFLDATNRNGLGILIPYQIVPGQFPSATLAKLNNVALGTAAGDRLNGIDQTLPRAAVWIKLTDGKVQIGDSGTKDAANVVGADVMAANGVIHVIDKVLVPDDLGMMTESMDMGGPATPEAGAVTPATIAQTVANAAGGSSKEFSTLLAAAQAADPAILTALTQGGPFTLFAPTDAAFAAALKKMNIKAEDLLKDKARLSSILAYHILPGQFGSNTLVTAAAKDPFHVATSLPGTSLAVTTDGKTLSLNKDVKVIVPDIRATNGVIHVIDGVLMPPTN